MALFCACYRTIQRSNDPTTINRSSSSPNRVSLVWLHLYSRNCCSSYVGLFCNQIDSLWARLMYLSSVIYYLHLEGCRLVLKRFYEIKNLRNFSHTTKCRNFKDNSTHYPSSWVLQRHAHLAWLHFEYYTLHMWQEMVRMESFCTLLSLKWGENRYVAKMSQPF